MKKIISILFCLIIIIASVVVYFFYPEFFDKQVAKVKAMYYVQKGDEAYRLWHYNKAIQNYDYALLLYPEHFSAWYNLGNIYVAYEDYYSAVDAYEKAIEHNPKYIEARMNYGIVSTEKLGDFDGAIAQYDEILNVKRRFLSIPFVYDNRKSTKINKGLANYNKGVAYKQKSIYSTESDLYKNRYLFNAKEAYEKAIKVLKKDYDTRYNLALTYHLLGEYHNAGLSYCKAIEIAPMEYEAHYNLAILLMHLKYYKESYLELEKATTLITNSDGMSNRQMYVFDVMNEVTRLILPETNMSAMIEHIDDEPMKMKGVTYVHGRLVATDELDKAIAKNLKTCGSRHIFVEEIDEDYVENYRH
ncbi:MAG: tetratricopeptide repeat protein [Candidatus Gastranaerophilales bacterium]